MACPDLFKFPAGSPERIAAVECQGREAAARRAKKETKRRVKLATPRTTMVKQPSPPQGNSGKSPLKAAIDTFKSDTWRTK